jgi:uncharacterized SAM-binding protein YcdF (DUF218 family)
MPIDFLFLLKKLLSVLLLPPLLPLLVIAGGLLCYRRQPGVGKTLAWGGVFVGLLLTTPAGVDLLSAPLEQIPVLQPADLRRAQAIVILGGGQRLHMPEYGEPAPNRLTLERLRYGARLARQSGLPVLVSGGAPQGIAGEAVAMARCLREDFNVAPRWQEVRSLDTADNARFSAEILRAAGIHRIVLVTHAAHMRRAKNEFSAQGLEVIPAPTGFFYQSSAGSEFSDYLPAATAAYAGWYTLHEWLGLLAQAVRRPGP